MFFKKDLKNFTISQNSQENTVVKSLFNEVVVLEYQFL